MLDAKLEAIRQKLIENANAKYAKYPQYKGHWDNWGLAVARKQIKGRGGVICLEKGEYCLISLETPKKEKYSQYPNVLWTAVYLEKNLGGCDTSVNSAHFEIQS